MCNRCVIPNYNVPSCVWASLASIMFFFNAHRCCENDHFNSMSFILIGVLWMAMNGRKHTSNSVTIHTNDFVLKWGKATKESQIYKKSSADPLMSVRWKWLANIWYVTVVLRTECGETKNSSLHRAGPHNAFLPCAVMCLEKTYATSC